ncbi:MAG TPA: hypothetical protein DEQ14_02655, partial [Treponema sp.]|nr:hypothetical protein [Treponema sp.]
MYDDVSYFALLYRTGTYAADSPRLTAEAETSRFAPDTINGIQYLEWEETGPLLEIKARLLSADGDSFPCR